MSLLLGVRLGIATLFVSSAVAKATELRRGTVRWHPVIMAHDIDVRVGEHLMRGAFVVDLLVASALVAWPRVGMAIGTATVAVYTAAAWRPYRFRNQPCGCFASSWFDAQSLPALMVRNVFIIIVMTWSSLARNSVSGVASAVIGLAAALLATASIARIVDATVTRRSKVPDRR